MRVFLALIIGIVLGVVGLWYYDTHHGQSRVESAGDAIQQKLHSLNLGTNSIKEELARTGRVLRDKAGQAGQAIADATADARLTGAIKAKLLTSRDLSARTISVNTTGGIVTLSGSVNTTEDISKAMMITLDTDGVRQVISTLQVKGRAGP